MVIFIRSAGGVYAHMHCLRKGDIGREKATRRRPRCKGFSARYYGVSFWQSRKGSRRNPRSSAEPAVAEKEPAVAEPADEHQTVSAMAKKGGATPGTVKHLKATHKNTKKKKVKRDEALGATKVERFDSQATQPPKAVVAIVQVKPRAAPQPTLPPVQPPPADQLIAPVVKRQRRTARPPCEFLYGCSRDRLTCPCLLCQAFWRGFWKGWPKHRPIPWRQE